MRCNRLKSVFGMFHLLCAVLIVSVVLGINAISSVEAVTQIGPGDRIFFLGNQWVKNRTVSQTGFEVIRLSSTEPAFRMRYVRDTLNLKLMIGLGGTVVPDDRPSPEGERAPWPGDTMDTALSAFRDSLANWLGRDRLDISAFHFNLEYKEEYYKYRYPDDPNDLAASKTKRVNALTDTMTLILKKYQRTIREVCDSLTTAGQAIGSYPKLWVFSAKGTGNPTYEEFGCDWNALTSGDYPIDVATMGVETQTISTTRHPTTGDNIWVPNLADLHIWGSAGHIKTLKGLTNGKPVVIQYHIAGSKPYRNVYHLYWNDFRTLARHFKALSEEGSSHFGGNYPVGYYQSFYRATIPDPGGGPDIEGVHFTLDESGNPPTDPFPWEDGQKYPARLWEDGKEGDWGFNATTNKHNKWEREFIANVLSATGTPLTGHTVPKTTTWRGEIYLIGDVVIPSGVTLTIDPGTVINFRPDTDVYEAGLDTIRSEIVVKNGGSLLANGTIQNPIIFQSSFRADGTDPSGEGWQGAIKIKDEETGKITKYDPILYNPGKDDWGGIRNEGGTLTLQHCVISDAEVGVEITGYQGTTSLSEVDLSANHFGLKVHEGVSVARLALTNIGLYYNRKGISATLYGPGHVEMRNATIADNLQGAGFTAADGDILSLKFKNTIVAFNTVGIYTAGTPLSSPTLTLQYCDVFGAPASGADFQGVYTAMPTTSGNIGNVSVDPKFVAHTDSLNYDYHLQASSPLIDAGDPSMTEADSSRINMGRYGGTAEYTSVSSDGESSTKPTVLKTEDVPLVFSLSQNAPNPFNPETIISYSLPQSEQVKLVIYNVLGQEIRTLVNAFKPAGRYRVVWNSKDDFGRSVSSGVYFYQITAGKFTNTRKMLILK